MQKDIHPTFFNKAKVTCSCGNTFTVGSTTETITVEICSNCHPFWTGETKFIDAEGRVDKFKRKQDVAAKARKKKVKAIKEKIDRQKARDNAPTSIKDMLKQMQ